MEIIGLDLHKRESQLAIKADDGTITDRRIATSRERFTAVLGARRRAHSARGEYGERVGGPPPGVTRPRGDRRRPELVPMYANRSRRSKTDTRDARTLMDACETGAYRPAYRLAEARRHVRADFTESQTARPSRLLHAFFPFFNAGVLVLDSRRLTLSATGRCSGMVPPSSLMVCRTPELFFRLGGAEQIGCQLRAAHVIEDLLSFLQTLASMDILRNQPAVEPGVPVILEDCIVLTAKYVCRSATISLTGSAFWMTR